LDFYNQRRRQLKEVHPNQGHLALTQLEEQFDVTIVTQNVDNLHERAGSSNIIHLHGELQKGRSERNEHLVIELEGDINEGDLGDDGHQIRPHIVWFGEAVPMLEKAAHAVYHADHLLIIGTSMQVYPAAGLVSYAPPHCPIYYIDPKPHISYELQQLSQLNIIEEVASKGVPKIVNQLLKNV